MSIASAEVSFNKGLAALTDGQPLRAVDHFLDAMQIEQRLRSHRPDMRYLSYYGLSLARAQRALHPAIEACSLAVRREPRRAELLLNLGHVFRLAGRRDEALGCFERGLLLAPNHPALSRERQALDRRSPPLLRFVAREHPLNRWLGRARESLRPRTP